jgi:hypothetical protein
MLCIEQNDEWLVGRGYLSAESISLVLADRDDHTNKESKEEVVQLQPAWAAGVLTDDLSAPHLHHVPGVD